MRAGWFGLGVAALFFGAAWPIGCGQPFTAAGTGGASSSSGSGQSATGGGASATGAGGAGSQMSCKMASDCPPPSGCTAWKCDNGSCEAEPTKDEAFSQVYGDCHTVFCSDKGGTTSQEDSNDKYDDGDECTDDTCDNGTPVNTPEPAGTPCGTPGLGMKCDGKGKCVLCNGDNECAALYSCAQGLCVPPHCLDQMPGFPETDKDCGGNCLPCADGLMCKVGTDCASQVCSGSPGTCQPATCNDGARNGDETDVDCGGGCRDKSPLCADQKQCAAAADCASGVCIKGACAAPSCEDSVKNGGETGVDCGGGKCAACGP